MHPYMVMWPRFSPHLALGAGADLRVWVSGRGGRWKRVADSVHSLPLEGLFWKLDFGCDLGDFKVPRCLEGRQADQKTTPE